MAASTETVRAVGALQKAFVEALLRPETPVPDGVSAATQAQRVKRFNVYRNNVHASLADAVAARFPVIERLVGEEFFRAMALVFVERYPPTSPILSQYGGTFPQFVDTFEPAQDLPYLPDVARLEWARNLAYHAADEVALEISVLGTIPPEDLDDIRLRLHPATQLIHSPFPIVSIWQTNTHDEEVRPIGTDHGAECALVTRLALDVLVTELPSLSASCIAALSARDTLGTAVRDATTQSDAFDLATTLALLFASGAVAEIIPPVPQPNERTTL